MVRCMVSLFGFVVYCLQESCEFCFFVFDFFCRDGVALWAEVVYYYSFFFAVDYGVNAAS